LENSRNQTNKIVGMQDLTPNQTNKIIGLGDLTPNLLFRVAFDAP
jgi:hypothetical protein